MLIDNYLSSWHVRHRRRTAQTTQKTLQHPPQVLEERLQDLPDQLLRGGPGREDELHLSIQFWLWASHSGWLQGSPSQGDQIYPDGGEGEDRYHNLFRPHAVGTEIALDPSQRQKRVQGWAQHLQIRRDHKTCQKAESGRFAANSQWGNDARTDLQ